MSLQGSIRCNLRSGLRPELQLRLQSLRGSSEFHRHARFPRRISVRGGLSGTWAAADYLLPSSKKPEKPEKHEFDDIQDLIVSAPSVSSPSGKVHDGSKKAPTLLEKEAQALEGSELFSPGQERIEAMNGLLDVLEQKGVSPGYAFEFVRHAGDLLDDLFVEAKEGVEGGGEALGRGVDFQGEESSSEFWTWSSSLKGSNGFSVAESEREKRISELLEAPEGSVEEIRGEKLRGRVAVFSALASRVSDCADRRGLGRLVYYFQLIGMKAQNIPRVLPFVERGIDMVMANVEFLRSLGVQYNHLPGILVRWPKVLSFQCDSLARNVDYLVGLGLAPKDIGKMVIKFPQILGRPVELHKSLQVLENLGVQLQDVKKLVVRYPILLTEDAVEKLDPLVTYLEQLGVQRVHIGTVLIRRPLLLDSDVKKDLVPIGNYLKSLNASADDIDKILMSFPQLFGFDVEQDFRPTVLYLEGLGVESALMGKLFRRHPRLLKNRHKFKLKVDFLRNLGLEQKDLGKVIYNAPQLLSLSIGDNMEHTIEFLASIGITRPLLLKVLKLKPMILAYSVERKLKPNVKFLQSLLIKEEDIGQLVSRYPQLLTLSVEKNLRPTVTYLLKLGFTRAEVASMVTKLPSLLGFNIVTVLAPKYRYFVHVLKRPRRDVVQFPHYFSYSLLNRIIPRHQYLGKLTDSFSLNSLYGCSDVVFDKRARKWPMRMFAAKETKPEDEIIV